MSLDLRFSHAWFAETPELTTFLDLAYSDHYGEIWLYNNDLQVILNEQSFRELYRNRIAHSLSHNVDAVKILVRPDQAAKFFGPNRDPKVIDKFRQIALLEGGLERLSTFYFGVANDSAIPAALKDQSASNDTWVFYTHRGHLDHNSGVVMVRNAQFPFSGPEHRIVLVWLLRDHPVLQDRLKRAFENCFHDSKNFSWMKVTNTDPFEFELCAGLSPETRRRQREREDNNSPTPLSLRDSVDVAIVAALPEEMTAFEKLLGKAKIKVRATPLHADTYKYVLFKSEKGWRTVLLVTLNAMGGVSAAAITWDFLDKWKPRHVILVGVAGGDPREMQQNLGDVVYGQKVVGYEVAKIKEGELKARPRTYEPDQALLQAAGEAASKRWPKSFISPRPDGTKVKVKIHGMTIGSGSKLVADPDFFDWVETLHEGIHATEMEGDGIGYSCDQHSPKAYMLVVKGIMDRSDMTTRASDLRDAWKHYAAATAAEFVYDVLKLL